MDLSKSEILYDRYVEISLPTLCTIGRKPLITSFCVTFYSLMVS